MLGLTRRLARKWSSVVRELSWYCGAFSRKTSCSRVLDDLAGRATAMYTHYENQGIWGEAYFVFPKGTQLNLATRCQVSGPIGVKWVVDLMSSAWSWVRAGGDVCFDVGHVLATRCQVSGQFDVGMAPSSGWWWNIFPAREFTRGFLMI